MAPLAAQLYKFCRRYDREHRVEFFGVRGSNWRAAKHGENYRIQEIAIDKANKEGNVNVHPSGLYDMAKKINAEKYVAIMRGNCHFSAKMQNHICAELGRYFKSKKQRDTKAMCMLEGYNVGELEAAAHAMFKANIFKAKNMGDITDQCKDFILKADVYKNPWKRLKEYTVREACMQKEGHHHRKKTVIR